MAPHIPDFPKALFEELDTDKLRRRFLEALLEFQNVERGSIWIKREDGYQCIEATGGEDEERLVGFVVPKDKPSIVGWVIENGKMTIAEPGKDKRHFKEAESGLDVKSTLILCYPLALKNGDVWGAVEIIDTAHAGSRLNLGKEYLELLEEFVAIGSLALGNALAFADQKNETQKLRKIIGGLKGERPLVGKSPAFRTALETARNYSRTDYPVLITGESGTGKELFAWEIHSLSDRKDKPFLVQNVSAIPDTLLESELFGYKRGAFTGADKDKVGLFEAADGGTVFLDEIGDMPLTLQARILRVLQEHEIKPLGGTQTRTVDVRVIAATNRDLSRAIAEGTFREDLFYRVNVLPLPLPPLRERPEDIPELLDYFLSRDAARLCLPPKKLSAEALMVLRKRSFPGNVREMENLVRFLLATVCGEVIEAGDIPPASEIGLAREAAREAAQAATQTSGDKPEAATSAVPDLTAYTWESLEHAYALALLEKFKWNVTKAARAAGVNRSTFDSRLRKLGITKE